ncbi:hypothetical protein SAMN04487770_11943 [Butyrivibrio sp. ob235]|uniref:hypothetical protein n=1 Tax=Butyrivibrio sp. ob235 TaxID=1761780 RepID=UPI0008B611E7|nr:hypothetical protein [Butyrivibrio sp. ob235]SEL85949.1 hypothetical protein SAMN04487770_11943 [Butyrivibrio sp. ob235]
MIENNKIQSKRMLFVILAMMFILCVQGCSVSNGKDSINGENQWENIESVKIYFGYLDGDLNEEGYEPLIVTDEKTIQKLVQYISDDSKIEKVKPDELYEGMNSIFVDFGNGIVVSMYDDLNYGNIGPEMVEYGDDVWLPKQFYDLVISLLEKQ